MKALISSANLVWKLFGIVNNKQYTNNKRVLLIYKLPHENGVLFFTTNKLSTG